ncbi:MAG: TetR/AcrR family transcriptional regulator [Thermoguttaceae bacterium]
MRLSETRKACVTAMMRDAIFEAAGSVVERYGTRGLTMDRVATGVGLTAGSLYTYFNSKDELLRFLHDRLVEPFLDAIEAIAGERTSALRKLKSIFRTALDRAVQRRAVIRLLADAECGDELRKNVRPRLLRVVAAIFEQGVESGEFRPHDASHAARMYLGGLSEMFELLTENAADDEVRRFGETLIDATVHGFSIRAKKRSVRCRPAKLETRD